MTTLAFAAAHASERSVVIGALGIRVLHYVAESVLQPTRAVAGLIVRFLDRSNRPAEFHRETGIYGYIDLRPGTVTVHISDPLGRYVERSARFTVPDRTALRRALERGLDTGASSIAGIVHTVFLRPAIGHPVRSGQTSVWGMVRTVAGVQHPYARLDIVTRRGDGAATRLITHADARGQYRFLLQNERVAFTPPTPADGVVPATVGSINTSIGRDLTVHVLRNPPDPNQPIIRAFPPDFDTLVPQPASGPYRPVTAVLRNDVTGVTIPPAPALQVPVEIGRNRRWDVVTP